MADINLLPVASNDHGPTSKVAGIAKKIGVISSVILIAVLLVYAAIYGYFYVNGSVTTSSITTLENQIKAQEQTEQKIVLLRDRITKAAHILSQPSSDDEITALSDILTHLPEGVTIKESKIFPTEFTITVHAEESSKITEFVRSLTESGKYSQIESASMNFSTKEQYLSVYRLALSETN
jgi:hypothetical protein